jgi:hypothetical protein
MDRNRNTSMGLVCYICYKEWKYSSDIRRQHIN